jgi:hypothetical protein
MLKSDIGRTVTAVLATVLMSVTCLAAAIGPAQPDAGRAAVAMAAKFVA